MLLRLSGNNFLRTCRTALNPCRNAGTLESVLEEKIAAKRKHLKAFRKSYGKFKYQSIEIDMMYGGMRDMVPAIWELSEIDYQKGVHLRGLSLSDCIEKLPKEPKTPYPSGEAILWLLLTGDVPNDSQVNELRGELTNGREKLCELSNKLLRGALSKDMIPISRVIATLTMTCMASEQRKAYGTKKKTDFWKATLPDALTLLAKAPEIMALAYRFTYFGDAAAAKVEPNSSWITNFVKMLGVKGSLLLEFMALFVLMHADHDGANATTHAARLIASALSDPYISLAGGFCALAGKEEGKVIKYALAFLEETVAAVGPDLETGKLRAHILSHLKQRKLLPGFGHAILKRPDPRFLLQVEFGKKHFPNDPLFRAAVALADLVPGILYELRPVRCPYPNTDLISGVFLKNLGIKEVDFYTCLIAFSRIIGITSGFVWDRALMLPIERPKTYSTRLMEAVFIKPDII